MTTTTAPAFRYLGITDECGHRYDESLGDGIHPRHAAHLADHTERG